jgi:hypothetical protein
VAGTWDAAVDAGLRDQLGQEPRVIGSQAAR